MKKLISIASIFVICITSLFSQTIQKKNYYDVWETKIKTVWHELGDGTLHGIQKGYDENGKLQYTHVWERGVWTSLKYYYQDGQTRIESKKLSSGKFDGQQLFYLFDKGQRYLKVKAVVNADVVKEYYFYEKPNVLGWSLIFLDDSYIYKRYKPANYETVDITISSGLISGVIEKTGNDNFKLVLKNNNIISFINSNSFYNSNEVTNEVSSGLIFSELNQKNQSSTLYRIKTKNCNFKVETKLDLDLFNYQLSLSVTVNEYKDRFSWDLDPMYDNSKTDINSLIYTIFNQYQDSIKAYKNANGEKVSETKYDNGKEIWTKEYSENGNIITCKNANGEILTETKYDNGKEIWTKEYWENGNVKSQKFEGLTYSNSGDNIQRILYYNEQGILETEVQGDNYFIYNETGDIVDSKALQDTLDRLVIEAEAKYSEIQAFQSLSEKYMEKSFCLSPQTGEYINICFNKSNENIYNAVRALYKEFIQNWQNSSQKIIQGFGNSNDNFSESNNQKINSNSPTKDRILSIKEVNAFYDNYINDLAIFDKEIKRFEDILNNPENTKKYNKSLNKIENPNEIRNIVGIKV